MSGTRCPIERIEYNKDAAVHGGKVQLARECAATCSVFKSSDVNGESRFRDCMRTPQIVPKMQTILPTIMFFMVFLGNVYLRPASEFSYFSTYLVWSNHRNI